jgi:hypothetical protein
MQLLIISDANVPIDIECGNLTSSMFNLRIDFAVPDVLFEKELKARHNKLLDFGLKIKSLSDEAVDRAIEFAAKYPHPSRMDLFALSLAVQEKCPLLTGDKNLKKAADKESVQVHGTLWLLDKMLNEKIIHPAEARNAFQRMKEAGSRLPWDKVENLLYGWGLPGLNPTNS